MAFEERVSLVRNRKQEMSSRGTPAGSDETTCDKSKSDIFTVNSENIQLNVRTKVILHLC